MAKQGKDPTEPMRLKASQYSGVDEGTACTQSSFKTDKKAFLFVGMQGGRYKAMFKLQKSRGEAIKLAEKEPDNFQVGSSVWITARFTAEKPMPRKLWEKWLDESYELSQAGSAGKKTISRKTATKKVARKKAPNKKPPTKASSRAKRK
jgi:hypothetical protein